MLLWRRGGGRALRTIPVSTHRFGAGHTTFWLFSKPLQDPPRRAEAGQPLPPRRHHFLKRGPLQAPRGTAAFGTAMSAETHTEPARTQPNRQPTKRESPETNLTLKRAGCKAATGRPVLPPHLHVGKLRLRKSKRLHSAPNVAPEGPLAGSSFLKSPTWWEKQLRRGRAGSTGCGEKGCSIPQPWPHLKHAPTLTSLGSNFGGIVEVAGVG